MACGPAATRNSSARTTSEAPSAYAASDGDVGKARQRLVVVHVGSGTCGSGGVGEPLDEFGRAVDKEPGAGSVGSLDEHIDEVRTRNVSFG